MTNAALAQAFSELAKLMEYRGENSFKIRSYTSVADTLKKGNVNFGELAREDLLKVGGIGEAIADKITELVTTGRLELYDRYVADTPPLAIQLLTVKGLGPKKVKQLVSGLEVESVGELLHAAEENRVAGLKGWSTASQKKLHAQLTFYQASQRQLRYAAALPLALELLNRYRALSPRVELTGQLRRQTNTVDALEFLAIESPELLAALESDGAILEALGPDRASCATLSGDGATAVHLLQ